MTCPYRCFRGAVMAVGAIAALLAVVPAAGAADVPASGTLTAQSVSAGGSAGGDAVTVPLRVMNPARYAAQKGAADAAYAQWAATSPFSPTLGTAPPLSSVGLNTGGLTSAPASNHVTPPDTTGAAGTTAYLEFVNSQLGVFSKSTGALSASVPESTFVAHSGVCDGQIKWDQVGQRYLYYSLDCAQPAGSEGFSFGFSKTSSPTPLPTSSSSGNWCRYHVSTGSTIEDYGKLGNSNQFLIFGTNAFNDVSGNYLNSPIIEFPKPSTSTAVTTCPTESGKSFAPAPIGVDFTPEPANVFGSSTTGFIVAVNYSGSTASNLRLYTLTGTAASPVLTDKGNIAVGTWVLPPSVPQPSPAPAKDVIDSLDGRLTQANAVVDPRFTTSTVFGIWTQHTISLTSGAPSVVRWYEVRVGSSTPVQKGAIAVSGQFVFNGAISPTTGGRAAAIDYNVGSKTLLPQIRARFHPAGAANGVMSTETTLGTSAAIDSDFSCPSVTGTTRPCRWGDYAGASFDPSSSTAVWGSNQSDGALVASHGAQWRTRNFKLIP